VCDCFEPVMTEHELGYSIAIGASDFNEEVTFAYSLFDSHLEDELISSRIRYLLNDLKLWIGALKRPEPIALSLITVNWGNNSDFISGYQEGLLDLSKSLEGLLLAVERFEGAAHESGIFDDVVLPWADQWQYKNRKLDVSSITPVCQAITSYEKFFLVSSQLGNLIPYRYSGGSGWNRFFDERNWMRLHELGAFPAKELIEQIWQVSSIECGAGLSFQCNSQVSQPLARERWLSEYEFQSLCEKHWDEVCRTNDHNLSERGLLAIQPVAKEVAKLLQVSPADYARELGDVWIVQESQAGSKLFMRPGRHELISCSIVQGTAFLPAVGLEIDAESGEVVVGVVEGFWVGNNLKYNLAQTETGNFRTPDFLRGLDYALSRALSLHEELKRRCVLCQELVPPYYLAKDGYCIGCGSGHR
jgi:hypothetical protein